MAAISKNKYDVYVWLGKVINTSGCVKKGTPYKRDVRSKQFNNCLQLLKLFKEKYQDNYLYDLLTDLLIDRVSKVKINPRILHSDLCIWL